MPEPPDRARGWRPTSAAARQLSALRWGDGDPELVLLHGGAQNAHTWDTVALALGRPLVAIDLPGHGHSSHRDDHVYWPADNAVAVEAAVRALAPDAKLVVGMSLGGLTALALTDRAPDVVRSLVLVDVTPGREPREVVGDRAVHRRAGVLRVVRRDPRAHGRVQPDAQRVVVAARHPAQRDRGARRPVALALRPAAARERRRRRRPHHARARRAVGGGRTRARPVHAWCAAACRRSSTTTTSPSCGGATRGAVVEVVEGAGHSVQGDKPLELARIARGPALTRAARAAPVVRRDARRVARAGGAGVVGRVLPSDDAHRAAARRRAASAPRCSATASGCGSTRPRSCTSAAGTTRRHELTTLTCRGRVRRRARSARRRCSRRRRRSRPTRRLPIDRDAALALADWYALGAALLADLRAAHPDVPSSDAQLWPEHFDLACELGDADAGTRANYGVVARRRRDSASRTSTSGRGTPARRTGVLGRLPVRRRVHLRRSCGRAARPERAGRQFFESALAQLVG